MSDLDDLTGLYGDDLLAAEYALGVLDGAAHRAAERRLARDAGFATLVESWQGRLSPMLARIAPQAVPEGLWSRIDEDLSRVLRQPVSGQPVSGQPVSGMAMPGMAASGGAASGVAASAANSPTPGKGDRRLVSGLWQWFGLGSFGLLTASLAVLLLVTQPRPDIMPLTASLAGETGAPLYTAVVYPGSRSATLVPVSVGDDPLHSHELWLIEPSKPPLSLGVLVAKGPLRIEISPELLATGGVLAISLEPIGGSPTGQPTGPVVATGSLAAI